MNFGEQFSVS